MKIKHRSATDRRSGYCFLDAVRNRHRTQTCFGNQPSGKDDRNSECKVMRRTADGREFRARAEQQSRFIILKETVVAVRDCEYDSGDRYYIKRSRDPTDFVSVQESVVCHVHPLWRIVIQTVQRRLRASGPCILCRSTAVAVIGLSASSWPASFCDQLTRAGWSSVRLSRSKIISST